jgi:glutaminyl-peptide cyclotransferase
MHHFRIKFFTPSLFLSLIAGAILAILGCQPNEGKKSGTANQANNNSHTPAKSAVQVPSFNADSTFEYINKQVSFGPRVPGSKGHKACGDWLTQQFAIFTDTVLTQKATVKSATNESFPMRNIIASTNPNLSQRILLCAHWDTRREADQDTKRQNEPILGANDGGSGVGVLLEIARQLKAKPLKTIGVDFVLFDVEDQGKSDIENSYCLGATYWSSNPHIPGYKAQYGILFDMVGAGDAVFLREGNSMQYAAHIVNKVWNTAAEIGYNHYFENRNTYPITDDHVAVNKILQIPTIDIIQYDPEGFKHGFGDFWHTHNDDMGIISKPTLKAVGQTVLTVLYRQDEPV